jgi:hypothetical protein
MPRQYSLDQQERGKSRVLLCNLVTWLRRHCAGNNRVKFSLVPSGYFFYSAFLRPFLMGMEVAREEVTVVPAAAGGGGT